MEAICVKLDEHVLTDVDNCLKQNNFSTRTEFIRAAIREKLEETKRKELLTEFLKLRGKAKTRTSDKQLHKIKEQALEELAKERNWI